MTDLATGSPPVAPTSRAARPHSSSPSPSRSPRATANGVLDVDYLVVGAGAMGMAFADALTDHADVRVALVDRRHGVGGHWLAAYPFVRLHQASVFYGVASTMLGDGRLQRHGPETGLQERASQAEVCAYYARALERMTRTGSVDFLPNCEYVGDRTVVSLVSGRRFRVPERCRIVDARYLSPSIPAETPPPFAVAEGARAIAAGDVARLAEAASEYVVVGSGKTATDVCVWLRSRGVDPDAIRWVRPRDPWMLNRAVVQPDPAIFLGMVADLLTAAEAATSLDHLFLRLEDAGVMLRVDRSVRATMARTPTLAAWELDELRTIENVVRRGHLRAVERGRLVFTDGAIDIADDALVVHCAADGLKHPPLVPVWGPERITLQPIRAAFPCFGAALIGYVEATRDDDAEKNRVCAPSPYPDSMAEWARMNVIGIRNAKTFSAEPDIKAWADRVAINPSRIPPGHPSSPALDDALERLASHAGPGLARLAALAGLD